MRKFLLVLGIMALICSPAMAGKNFGGAMVVHTDDTINYTFFDPPDYCGLFPDPGVCEELNFVSNYVDPNGLLGAVVYLVAAFPDGSSPGVTVVYFGIEHNFAPGFISGWDFCGPPNTLEIPDDGWPDDWMNAGNSVAFGEPVVGDYLFPFYWFGVYGDAGNYIGTGINPTGGYAGFVDDQNPGQLDEIDNFGQVAWFEGGFNMCPEPPTPEACCFEDGSCVLYLPSECEENGGVFYGGDCEPVNPCPQPFGACCYPDGTCLYVQEADCDTGDWTMFEPCEPNPCDQPFGACCYPDATCEYVQEVDCPTGDWRMFVECDPNPCEYLLGACCDGPECLLLTEEECLEGGYDPGWFGDEFDTCDPNPCPPVPVEESTWGQIKANY
jgi:hypothetical protein